MANPPPLSALEFSGHTLRISDNVWIDICDENWAVQDRVTSHNVVTATGRNIIRDAILTVIPGTSPVGWAPTHIALGTGSNAALDTDTALQTEVAGERYLITSRSSSDARATFQLFLDTSQGNGNTFREAILTDHPDDSSGNTFARATFTDVVKTSSISLVITWHVDLTST